jgi:hypothetical protein
LIGITFTVKTGNNKALLQGADQKRMLDPSIAAKPYIGNTIIKKAAYINKYSTLIKTSQTILPTRKQ